MAEPHCTQELRHYLIETTEEFQGGKNVIFQAGIWP